MKIKAEDVTTFTIPRYIVGDEVMIPLKGSNYLHLVEVEAFANTGRTLQPFIKTKERKIFII